MRSTPNSSELQGALSFAAETALSLIGPLATDPLSETESVGVAIPPAGGRAHGPRARRTLQGFEALLPAVREFAPTQPGSASRRASFGASLMRPTRPGDSGPTVGPVPVILRLAGPPGVTSTIAATKTANPTMRPGAAGSAAASPAGAGSHRKDAAAPGRAAASRSRRSFFVLIRRRLGEQSRLQTAREPLAFNGRTEQLGCRSTTKL